MGKIRGLKRKFGNSLRDYKAYLTHYNGYIELYVPQVTYKENTIHGYSASKFLVKNTIKNIPSGANYIYVFDENNALNNHVIITNEKEELNLGLIKDHNGTKPEYIKNLEKNYNLKFERYLATWEMEEIEYLHLEDEDKEDILYFEKEDDKVIAVTNILWTSSGFNDI
ncbi:TPA: hypothetical protein ACURE6_002031 [Staphylococcus aureus]